MQSIHNNPKYITYKKAYKSEISKATHILLSTLKAAEKRANKEGWIEAQDLENELKL